MNRTSKTIFNKVGPVRTGFRHVEGSLCVEALSTSRKYYSRSRK